MGGLETFLGKKIVPFILFWPAFNYNGFSLNLLNVLSTIMIRRPSERKAAGLSRGFRARLSTMTSCLITVSAIAAKVMYNGF